MDILGKDVSGHILLYLTPTDWVCAALTSKKWNRTIKKWLQMQKKIFYHTLKNELMLFAIDLRIYYSEKICIRPMYYGNSIGEGCRGKVINYLCSRHRMHSKGLELCDHCNLRHVSQQCFGLRCNSMECRDYMYLLKDGKAVKVKCYNCCRSDCPNLTDKEGGKCYRHAIYSQLVPEEELPSYRCICLTKSGNQCKNKTSSRLKKCYIHSKIPI